MPPMKTAAGGSKAKGGESTRPSWYDGLTAPIKELGSGEFADVLLYSLKSDPKQVKFAVKEMSLAKLTEAEFSSAEIRRMIEMELRLNHYEEFKHKELEYVRVVGSRLPSKEQSILEAPAHYPCVRLARYDDARLCRHEILRRGIVGEPRETVRSGEVYGEGGKGEGHGAEEHTWILQLADALDYLHSRRVSHTDVEPKNILIDIHAEQPDIIRDAILADLGTAHDEVRKRVDENEQHRMRSDVRSLVQCYAVALIGFEPTSKHFEGIAKSRIRENEKGIILGVLGGDECNRSAKALKCWPVFQGDNRNVQDPDWSSRLPQGHPLAASRSAKSKSLMECFADGDGKCSTREGFLADGKVQHIVIEAHENGVLVAGASPLMVVCDGERGHQSTAKGHDRCAPGTVYRDGSAQMPAEVMHLSDLVKVSPEHVEPWSKFHSLIESAKFVPTAHDVHMAQLLKWEKPTKEVVDKIMRD